MYANVKNLTFNVLRPRGAEVLEFVRFETKGLCTNNYGSYSQKYVPFNL